MKNIFSSVAMLMMASLAFVACDSDNDSNPILANKNPEFKLNTPEFSQMTVDLAKAESYPLTWSAPVFLSLDAPTVVSYTVNISKDGHFTKSYEQAKAEAGEEGVPSGHDYVSMNDDKTTDCQIALPASAINLAINQLYNTWEEDQVMTPMTLYISVTAAVVNAPLEVVASSNSNVVEVQFLPFWVNTNKKGVDCIYVPGNGQGWAPDSAPALTCTTGDGVYVGYAYLDGDFKFTLKRNWDNGEYNNGSFTTESSCIDLGDGAGGNITFTEEASLCYIVVDVNNKTLAVTPVKWSLIGDFNGWGDDVFMTYDKDAKALVAKDVDITGGWKFRRDSDWAFNLGGPLTNLVQDGENISGDGVHTVYLYVECNGMGPGTDTPEPVFYGVVK